MSKARLVITAVVIEGRKQAEVARTYGISESWVSKLVARYKTEGETAFEPKSRRPKTSPTAISDETADLISVCGGHRLEVRRDHLRRGDEAVRILGIHQAQSLTRVR